MCPSRTIGLSHRECIQNTYMQCCSCLLLPTIYREPGAIGLSASCALRVEYLSVCACIWTFVLINEGSGIGHLQKGTFWVLLFINRLNHSQPPSSSSKTEWKTSLLSHVIKIWYVVKSHEQGKFIKILFSQISIEIQSNSYNSNCGGWSVAIIVAISILPTDGELSAEASDCQLGCALSFICSHAITISVRHLWVSPR